MKTIEEAIGRVMAPDGLEPFKEITDPLGFDPGILRIILTIMGLPDINLPNAVLKGLAAGICIGIEMER